MKPRRAGLARLLAGGALLLAVAAGATVHLVTGSTLALAAVLGWGLVAAAAALVFGRRLAGRLALLRTRLLEGPPAHAGAAADRASIKSAVRRQSREVALLADAVQRAEARALAREAELLRGSLELAAVLDAVTEGILQLDAGGRMVRANPSARALLGMGGGGIGQPITMHVKSAELRRLLGGAASEARSAEVAVGERRLLVSSRPLPGEGGAVVAFVDLTEVRRLEAVRRDFVANVSHELKTPLTSIRGYAETLLSDAALLPETQHQFLEVIHRNADRLHRIVEDLLDLSRLESGGWRPEAHELNAAELVRDVWSGFNERAAARRVAFVPPAAAVDVLADPGGLRQVLSNLLDNALRYSRDGGRIEVVIAPPQASVRGTHPLVTIEVRDDGAGIPTDALPRIFERFYRVDPSRSRADGGTGLGLAIVKHLVERMGGDVAAGSELGKGTTIRIRLPAAVLDDVPAAVPAALPM
jgi:two-component system, OmpR family, phosphate regulon sensor histidine kinase PhoR